MKQSVLKYSFALVLAIAATISYGKDLPPDSLFQQAGDAYQAGDFAEAKNAYRQILDAGWHNGAVHYNLANCHYKLGNLGSAILHYQKALKLNPGDEEIKHNLQLAQEKRIDRFEKIPQPLFKRAYQGFITWLTPLQWAWIAIGAAAALLFGLAFYFFTTRRRTGFTAALTGFFILAIALSGATLHSAYRKNNKPAVVMEPAVYVKSGPSPLAEDAFILHEGTTVHLIENYEQWVKLRLSDGKMGWAKRENFSKI